MSQLGMIVKDGLILFVASTVLAIGIDQSLSVVKGKLPKDDPVVTAMAQGDLAKVEESIRKVEAKLKDGEKATTQPGERNRTSLMRAAYANLSATSALDHARALCGFGAPEGAGETGALAGLLRETDEQRVPVVVLLLDHGAQVNDQDVDGWSALMWAAWSGLPGVSNQLLERGADFAAVDQQGNTALQIAAQRGHAEIVKALLAKGADRSHRNKAGKNAFDLAQAGFARHPAKKYPEYVAGFTETLAALK